MRILVTGSSGLVGSRLVPALESEGHHVARLTRAPSASAGTIILWQPDASSIVEDDRLEGLDVVIHLAGENIGNHRWTNERKAAIRNSRVQGTGLLARTLADLHAPPRLFISASAIGYYGNRGEEELTETSAIGTGFLAGVCRDWEEAAGIAQDSGIRTLALRTGFIVSPDGGGLAKMLPPFRLGLGGRVGTGRQWMSWVGLHDVVGAILHLVKSDSLSGPVNLVSPHPVRNSEFTRILGRVLSRPTPMVLPVFAADLIIGEMAGELLLASTRVLPTVLQGSGYEFKQPDLETALREALLKEG